MPSEVRDFAAMLDDLSPSDRLEFERGLVSSSSLSDDLLSRLEVLVSDETEDEEDV